MALVLLVLIGSPRALFADAPPCRSDPALTEVAIRWVSGELKKEGVNATPAALAEAARAAGSDRVFVRGAWLREEGDRGALLSSFDTDAPLVCGEAASEQGTVLVAASEPAVLELQGVRARVQLTSGYSDPFLAVRATEQRVRLAPDEEGVFDLRGIEGPALLQLLAVGPDGVVPVAQRTWAGQGGEEREGSSRRTTRRATTTAVLETIDAARRESGSGTLRANRLLSSLGGEQAVAVCEAGRVSHGLGQDNPEARALRAGLEARVIGEVSARASSVAAALDALFQSPSHEMALLDERFTDVGYGVAEDESGRSCLVVMLASWPRRIVVSSVAP